MLNRVLKFGVFGGLIVGVPMVLLMMFWRGADGGPAGGIYYGFAAQLVALTMVFLGVKAHRDKALGGVIKFLPALGLGLAISAVASVIYALGWEVSLAITKFDFAAHYTETMAQKWKADGIAGADYDKRMAEMADFAKMYANPAFRIPITFTEMFPTGILVSLVSAGLLRNSRFLPARG